MRSLIWFLAGVIALPVIIGGAGLIFLKTRANGFSARAQPSVFETMAAQTARGMALPTGAREKRNPVAKSNDVLSDARAHWADHCATCPANDRRGQTGVGPNMYPAHPDLPEDAPHQSHAGRIF